MKQDNNVSIATYLGLPYVCINNIMSVSQTYVHVYVLSTVAILSFSQSIYSVNENDGAVQPVLVLSAPLSDDITVDVQADSVTATASGK